MIHGFQGWDSFSQNIREDSVKFLLMLSRNMIEAAEGGSDFDFPVNRKGIVLNHQQVRVLVLFIVKFLELEGRKISWLRRRYYGMVAKTLANRIEGTVSR